MTSTLATRYFEEPASAGKAELHPLIQQCKSQPRVYKGTESTSTNDSNTNTVCRFVDASALPEGT